MRYKLLFCCVRSLVTLCFIACSAVSFAQLQVQITTSSNNVVVGDQFSLDLTVMNTGGASVADVDARVFFLIEDPDENRTHADLVSATSGCTVNTSGSQGFVSCLIPALAGGAEANFTLLMEAVDESSFFLLPSAFLVDDFSFVTDSNGFLVRSDLQINVARDLVSDTDGDGVADLAEELVGFDAQNAFLTPKAPTLDLLVYYTPGASALYGGAPLTRINHLIAVANQISSSSGAGIQYALAAAIPLAASDTDTNPQALSRMRNRSGVFAALDGDRNANGADLVLLMRPFINGTGNCGFASVLGVGRSGDLGFGAGAEDALGTVSIDCRDRTTAHEMGHILGLTHDRRDGGAGTFDYSHGYGVDNTFVTVMGVASNFSVFSNQEVNLFSSPDLDCGAGIACGIDKNDAANSADAVSSLQYVGILASTFRFVDQDGDLVPDDQDAFPGDPIEKFDTDDDGIGNVADIDDDGDGIPDMQETMLGFNTLNAADGLADADGDGSSNAEEIAAGTDFLSADEFPGSGVSGVAVRVVRALRRRR